MEAWREVEVAACEELPLLLGAGSGPTEADLEAIRRATFTVEAVNERERTTDHDMAAFVDVLAASAGEAGRWIHFGLTSSDVLDTALALQLKAAGEAIVPGARALLQALATRAREHVQTLCVGRTHGVHAEPTTFGVKLAGLAFEAHRNALRLERAFAQVSVGGISGAVGTYAATSPEFEERVLARLGLGARVGLHAGGGARPPRGAAERDRARGGRHGAPGDRGAPPAAHGGARGAGAVPRRPEGLERDAAQAQPDQGRADLRARTRAARQRAGGPGERGVCGTSATSPTPRSSGSCCRAPPP